MTHDVLSVATRLHAKTGQDHWEAFVQCRSCKKSAVWAVSREIGQTTPDKVAESDSVINERVIIDGLARPKSSTTPAPEFTPSDLKLIFDEGAECLAIGCWNASSAMFRKILDQVSKAKLPAENVPADNRTRYNLKPRLAWLFAHDLLPKELEQLADCIREDANDAVHNHPIGEPEARDVLDFTVEMLERLYTMPGRLEANVQRRDSRREAAKKSPPA
jgi:hypothetical protein